MHSQVKPRISNTMLMNRQGSVIGNAGRQIIPIGNPVGRNGFVPRGARLRATQNPAVTDKAQTQAKHVYHVYIGDKIVSSRMVKANAVRDDDDNIMYRVRIIPDSALREFETELCFISPVAGINKLAHAAGAQVRGFVSLANITREEFRDLVFGGVVTTQARRVQDAGSGYGGTGNQYVAASFGVFDIIHRGQTFINAGDHLMWAEAPVRPDAMVPGSVENQMPTEGMPRQVITPSIVPIKTGTHGYRTYSQTINAMFNNELSDEDIGTTGPMRDLKTSLDFIFARPPANEGRAEFLELLRSTCYKGDPLRQRLEEKLILSKMDAELKSTGQFTPELFMKWVILHITELQEKRFDEFRRRKIGRAVNSAGTGNKLTFEVDV